MEPVAAPPEPDRIAVRRCFTPACRACGVSGAVRLLRLHQRSETPLAEAPFGPADDWAASLDLVAARAGGIRVHYELCAEGVGRIRADRAGWLARARPTRRS